MTKDECPQADGVVVPMAGKRGYTNTHPPFEPGNEMALRHGAWSPRKIEPLALEILQPVLDLAATDGAPTSYLADVTYRATLHAWARTEARIQLVHEWLMDRGSEVDKDGEALGASNLLNQLEARAESLRARLGLDPLSRARLGRDLAVGQKSLAELMAEVVDE